MSSFAPGHPPRPRCSVRAFAAVFLLAAAVLRGEQPAQPGTALLDKVLALNRVQEPELDVDAAQKAFAHLLEEARKATGAVDTPREKIEALNQVLLTDRHVSYLSNKYWRDSTLAASLIRNQGNCLSTSTLYVLIGEELHLPLRMVLIPEHAYVRWDAGETQINIETTQGGIEVPESRYKRMAQTLPEDDEILGWGRSMTTPEFLATLYDFAARHRWMENRLAEAQTFLKHAETLDPGRPDRAFSLIRLESDLTGNRAVARRKMAELLDGGKLPPTLATSILMYFAEDVGAEGDHNLERELLLDALARAPKSSMAAILQELAFCHRALRDHRGAVRYMELAMALRPHEGPSRASDLYNYAILLKNDQRLDDALKSIAEALKLNPESWNLQMLQAGFLVLKGERERGLALYSKIEPPRAEAEFFAAMQAWFCAVSGQREQFYVLFQKALETARSVSILHWIDQDVDLDPYRNDPEFKALVKANRERLTGKAP